MGGDDGDDGDEEVLGIVEGRVSMVKWMRLRWSMIRVKSGQRSLPSRYISMVLI